MELQDVNLSMQFPITDGDMIGMTAAQRRDYLEQRYPADVERIKERLASANGMTVKELQTLLERILEWKYREETLVSETAEEDGVAQPDPKQRGPGDG